MILSNVTGAGFFADSPLLAYFAEALAVPDFVDRA